MPILCGDIIYEILAYDPNYQHRLVSKKWYNIVERLKTHFKAWNYEIDDETIAYINRNILKIDKWGDAADVLYYSKKLNREQSLLSVNTSNLCSYVGIPTYFNKFIEEFDRIGGYIPNNISTSFLFKIGIYNDVQILKFLKKHNVQMDDDLVIKGAIHYPSPDILQCYLDDYDVPLSDLDLATTICACSDPRVLDLVVDLQLKIRALPPSIRIHNYHFSRESFFKGLIQLKVPASQLDFTRVTIPQNGGSLFSSYRRSIINLLLEHHYYNDTVLELIIDSCLRYGYEDVLNKLSFVHRDTFNAYNIFTFIINYRTYLCLPAIKWIEKEYNIDENFYRFVFSNAYLRDIKVALWCLKRLRNPELT